MRQRSNSEARVVVGLDLGDKFSEMCVMERSTGEITEQGRLRTTPAGLEQRFGSSEPMRIAMETGPHSPWVSRQLEGYGHEVVVANARKLRCITESDRKSDRNDAEWLARLARLDVEVLSPVRHRGAQTQADLELLRARGAQIRARTLLVNHVRGVVKAAGGRMRQCSTRSFQRKAHEQIPGALMPALEPLIESIAGMTERIKQLQRRLEEVARSRYPQHELLTQPSGVATLTAMGFMLTIEDPRRFRRNRMVGAYLGMVPRRSQTGQRDPQMRITKAGDREVRRLLVMAAHYTLGPFGTDSDLRRWGLERMKRGGKNAKKCAVVAVARRLAVLMLSLWKNGEIYEPLRHASEACVNNSVRMQAVSA